MKIEKNLYSTIRRKQLQVQLEEERKRKIMP